MPKGAYRAVFDEGAVTFIAALSKRRQSAVIGHALQLAAHPFVRGDYSVHDHEGRPIEHLLVDDFVFAYWLDHAVREVRIVDIEDAS